MLASIHPLGERARGSRWGVTVASYVAGAMLGGVAVGAIAGGVGLAAHLLVPWSPTMAAAAALALGSAGALVDASPRLRLPSPARQVNEDWLTRYRGWVYGAGFGFQLGLGVATIVTSALVYVVLGVAVLTASVASGAAIGLAFGFARGAVLLAPVRVRRVEQLRRFHRRLAASAPAARRLAIGSQVVLAVVAAGALA